MQPLALSRTNHTQRQSIAEMSLQICQERLQSTQERLKTAETRRSQEVSGMSEISARLAALQQQNQRLQAQLEAEKRYGEQYRMSSGFHANRVYDLSAQLLEKQAELDSLHGSTKLQSGTLNSAQYAKSTALQETSRENAQLQSENELLESQNDTAAANMRAELLETEVQRLKQQICEQNTTISSQRNQLQLLQMQFSAAGVDFKPIVGIAQQVSSKVMQKTNTNSQEAKSTALFEQEAARMRNELETLKAAIQRLECINKTVTAQLRSEKQKNDVLRETAVKYANLKQKYDRLFIQARVTQRKYKEVEQTLVENSQQAQRKQEHALSDCNALRQQVQSSAASVSVLQSQNRALAEQNAALLDELCQLKAQCSETSTSALDMLRQQVRDLVRDKLALTAQIERMEQASCGVLCSSPVR